MFKSKIDLKALSWFNKVIFTTSEVALSTKTLLKDSQTKLRENDQFYWLPFSDGRGYLFPKRFKNPGNCLKIYNAQSLPGKLLKILFGLLGKSGLLRLLLPILRIRVVSPDAVDLTSENSFLHYLQHLFPETELKYSISLGTPGTFRKPVIQLMNSEDEIIGYAKIGSGDKTEFLVRNESAFLKWLSAQKPRTFVVPNCPHQGNWKGRYFCIQASLGNLSSAPASMSNLYLAPLAELAQFYQISQKLNESEYWCHLKQRIEKLQNSVYTRLLHESIMKLENAFGEYPLEFHPAHGDYAPWNAMVSGEKLYVYDWEYARKKAPAGYDFFHFYIQTLHLLKKITSQEIIKYLENSPEVKDAFDRYSRDFIYAPKFFKDLLRLYILDRFTFYVDEESENMNSLRLLSDLLENLNSE